MKIIDKFLKGLDYVEEALIVIFLSAMTILNFANVFSRYVLHASISLTEEVTIMCFVWVSMLAAATAYKRYAHLGMNFVVEQFNNKVKAIFSLFAMLCSLVFLVILFKYGWKMVAQQIKFDARTPAIRMPMCYQGLSIPVGALFMIIRTLESYIKEFLKLWKEGGNE